METEKLQMSSSHSTALWFQLYIRQVFGNNRLLENDPIYFKTEIDRKILLLFICLRLISYLCVFLNPTVRNTPQGCFKPETICGDISHVILHQQDT